MMMPEIEGFDEPLQLWSCSFAIYSQHLITNSINNPFTLLNETAQFWNKIYSEKKPWLVKTDCVLREFNKKIALIEGIDGTFLQLREAYARSPAGYITEIRVIIPDSNRELEYKIYDAFRELLRTSDYLLFNLHIIKRRGRQIEEVLPEGFWRYS